MGSVVYAGSLGCVGTPLPPGEGSARTGGLLEMEKGEWRVRLSFYLRVLLHCFQRDEGTAPRTIPFVLGEVLN